MFDIGWSEMMVVAVIAIIVVGPKDLPGMLRTVGRSVRGVRQMASQFQSQFTQAINEAERQSGISDVKNSINDVSDTASDLSKPSALNPIASYSEPKSDLDSTDDASEALSGDEISAMAAKAAAGTPAELKATKSETETNDPASEVKPKPKRAPRKKVAVKTSENATDDKPAAKRAPRKKASAKAAASSDVTATGKPAAPKRKRKTKAAASTSAGTTARKTTTTAKKRTPRAAKPDEGADA